MTKNIWQKLDEAIKNNSNHFYYDLSRLHSREVIPTFKELKNKGYDVQVESEGENCFFYFDLNQKNKKQDVDFSLFKKEEKVIYTKDKNVITANFKGVQ